MEKYIEVKIMKKHIIMFVIAVIMICGMGGYYIWCSNHPVFNIGIGEGGRGDDYKFEMPYATIEERHGIQMSASAQLKIRELINEHELMFQYVLDYYKTADIKLDMEVKKDQTILTYTGTATNEKGETEAFEKELVLEFGIDAKITKLMY